MSVAEVLIPTMKLRWRVTNGPSPGGVQVNYKTWTILEQCFHPVDSLKEVWKPVQVVNG